MISAFGAGQQLRGVKIDRCFVLGNGSRCKRSERMLAVEHYELIRRKVVIEGKSQRDVAKELHHSQAD